MIPLQSMLAVFRRNFIAYFVNPTGYVFITLFILLSAIAAFWRDGFFASNLANLDQLNGYFPLLILFFVPALTMNVWSEERRAGTDELLFTLPAHDADIVIGKYLAVLGIYTVAILFSLSHIVVLSWLGDPDLGLMAATYLGYWCTGAALLAVGMVGSFVARNATVAFLLGALLCSLFVILTPIQSLLGPDAGRMIRVISIEPHFETMAEGAISGGSLVYFIAVAACALIFNIWCAVRRRSNQRFFSAWSALSLVRGLAIVVIAGCVFMLVERSGASADLTSEKLHTLQPPSRALMTSLPDDRPVLIQAYLSPTMPEAYVGRRKTVVNLLRTLDALGGERVQVAMFDTEPFTERATAVSENYGIVPRRLGTMAAGQRTTVPVYFGLVFTSGPNELVIPFLDRGLPAEYEIVRSIQTVSRTKRKVVGVLDTDVSMFGGVDFRFNVNRPDWSIIRELRKQYDVRQVQVEGPYPSDLDALVAVMPSSLTQPQMNLLDDAIRAGTPTLMFDDPFPQFNPRLSPAAPKLMPRNQQGSNAGPPRKGDFDGLLQSLGLRWRSQSLVWATVNPHPVFAEVPPEIVFIVEHPENPDPFNDDSPITAGLQEIVLTFPGFIETRVGGGIPTLDAQPLMQTGVTSGDTEFSKLYETTPNGRLRAIANVERYASPQRYPLAMHVRGTIPRRVGEGAEDTVNVVMVSDADVIGEAFFALRREGSTDLSFDNVTFALNCIDVLVGDESFVTLRNHRPEHRTLTRVEAESQVYQDREFDEQNAAESAAQDQLTDAQERLNNQLAEIRARTDLDPTTRSIMEETVRRDETRRLEAVTAQIELEKQQRLLRARSELEQGVSAIQRRIKWIAAFVPPIPALMLGAVFFAVRYRREYLGEQDRLVEQ